MCQCAVYALLHDMFQCAQLRTYTHTHTQSIWSDISSKCMTIYIFISRSLFSVSLSLSLSVNNNIFLILCLHTMKRVYLVFYKLPTTYPGIVIGVIDAATALLMLFRCVRILYCKLIKTKRKKNKQR